MISYHVCQVLCCWLQTYLKFVGINGWLENDCTDELVVAVIMFSLQMMECVVNYMGQTTKDKNNSTNTTNIFSP